MEILVVLGLDGDEAYHEVFRESTKSWEAACKEAKVPCEVIGEQKAASENDTTLKDQIRDRLLAVGDRELWLVLIGHGTYNGREAKFNIAGEDFSAKELGTWCKDITGPLVVINTTSASAPFIRELAAKNRTIITATKSENEIFYTRFGIFFSKAITGIAEADLDNDDQVSLLECFLYASQQVADYYEQNGSLATEHAIIDDNGDGLGTRGDWFEGTTAVKTAKTGAEPDGLRAMLQVLVKNEIEKNFPPELRRQRDELELKVRKLRRKKSEMEESAYYSELEPLLRELALIYQKVAAKTTSND